jgi:Vault protein inter-alpha-trypsin domain
MKKILILSLLASSLFANAQSPLLTIKDKDSVLVKMSEMLVNVKIVGNIAYTTAEMHFTNKSNRQMEAELLFPLPEGVSVSRYAIDINGKMREAVPVNKDKGKQVFEAIEHRRVDPGLLERVEGNNFKTRIYPLMPNGERIVLIGYEQELSFFDKDNLAYQVLSKYPYALNKFEMNITVVGAKTAPTATKENIKWTANNQTNIKATDYTPNENWIIKIPITQDAPSVIMKSDDDKNYFYANTFIENKKILKQTPTSIGIIWDNSLSCKNKNLQKELELLDSYFKKINNTTITLYSINYLFLKEETFGISNGDWSKLKTTLEKMVYDGGTRFSQINVGVHDEYLFFTDGLSSLSENNFSIYKKPVYTITSSASADFAYLNFNALKTAADFINLNQVDTNTALDKLLYQSLRFLGIKENNNLSEIYPIAGTTVNGSFSIAGISSIATNDVTLLFGYGNTVAIEKKIILDAEKQSSEEVNIEKLWAQKKITNLEYQYAKNTDEIEGMGKQYGIVTQGTSLIVLESISDYLSYDIMPPLELRPEWDRIKKQQGAAALAEQKSNWKNIDGYFTDLFTWWKKDIHYKKEIPIAKNKTKKFSPPRIASNSTTVSSDAYTTTIPTGNNTNGFAATLPSPHPPPSIKMLEFNGESNKTDLANSLQGKVAGLQVSTVGTTASPVYSNVYKNTDKSLRRDATIDDDAIRDRTPIGTFTDSTSTNFNSDAERINTNSWSPDRNYLKVLKAAAADKKYDTYLEIREKEINNPNFYFDVAHYFYDRGDKQKALLVLSNIADLGSENHQLYKTLSYTLRQWNASEDAVFTTKKIVQWRAHEPQSHRDYAMALEENNQYQAAFDECIKALEVNYFGEMSGQYGGVEDIILMDINRMISEHSNINTSKLDKKYLKKMPVSVRVILNWNQMDVDIDMHVMDPNKEECYYGKTTTEAGARFSKDFTQGYGPEQYLLRNAIKGKYQITSNFYGETTLTENGPATVMVEIYIQKADGSITKKIKTIQANKVKENGILAEIVID